MQHSMHNDKVDWFKSAVDSAIKAKLIPDNGMETFRPNERITREEMALMIANALKFGGKKLDSDTLTLNIVGGTSSDTFSPKELTTRAQAAAMVLRMLQILQFVN
jgi:hypothetical protein